MLATFSGTVGGQLTQVLLYLENHTIRSLYQSSSVFSFPAECKHGCNTQTQYKQLLKIYYVTVLRQRHWPCISGGVVAFYHSCTGKTDTKHTSRWRVMCRYSMPLRRSWRDEGLLCVGLPRPCHPLRVAGRRLIVNFSVPAKTYRWGRIRKAASVV
jgi:hypothetical protein